jgi:Flp pilus assembly protein TadG
MRVGGVKEMRRDRNGERGGTLLEFTFVASVFIMLLVGIAAISHFYFTHNALVESTRRGARFATLNLNSADAEISNVVVYGAAAPAQGAQPLVTGLQTTNVVVERLNFGLGQGTVTVRIQNFNYNFVIPGINRVIAMPEYRTTLTGECVGFIPPNL